MRHGWTRAEIVPLMPASAAAAVRDDLRWVVLDSDYPS